MHDQTVFAAEGAGRYVHWGVILISVTNLAIVAIMVVLFVLAIALPFPGRRDSDRSERRS